MTDTARDERDADERYETARRSFEIAKDRYVQSVLAQEVGTRYAAFVEKRVALAAELERARADFDAANTKLTRAVKAYARRLPHRVDGSDLQRPSILERFSAGRSYGNALQALERRGDLGRTVARSEAELDEVVRTIDAILDARGRVVRRGLQNSAGFTAAVCRDPLLEIAYKRFVDAGNECRANEVGTEDYFIAGHRTA